MHVPFIPNWSDLRPFVAELWLVATIVAVLLTPFFVRKPNSACGLVSLLGLTAALASLIAVGAAGHSADSANRLGTMLVADGVAYLWKILLLLFVIGVVLMGFATTAYSMHEGDGPEFYTLLLGATLGMAVMGSASNLLMVFMAIEAASLPSYVLAGFRKTHRRGAEASLKYVLFGATASAVMAYGLSLLYGLYGTLQLYPSAAGPGLAGRIAAAGLAPGAPSAHSALLAVGAFGLICGLGFKIAAVPFHFWCPDVFEGAAVDVTAFLSVASKGAGLVLLLRVAVAVADAAGYQATAATALVAAVVGGLGAITCTLGNTAAFIQNNIKRLLAYSSIAHAGYMLCVVSLLVRHRPELTHPGDSAAQVVLLYLAVYLFMNLGAFTVAGVVARQADEAGSGARGAGGGEKSEDLSAFAGLGRRSPLLAACMTAFLFSLIGLPPLAGFTAKFYVLTVLVTNGGWWWLLVGFVGVNTVLSVYYYARILKAMYLEAPTTEPAIAPDGSIDGGFTGHRLGQALGAACAAALVLMFIGASPLTRLTAACGRFHDAGTQASPPVAGVEAKASIATAR